MPVIAMHGVDYSFAPPGVDAIVGAALGFVVRYLPYPGDQGKGLTVAERDELLGHGVGIGLVFESAGERHLGGYDAGVLDATLAQNALNALGVPASVPVFFACDFDAQPAQYTLIDAYQQGAAAVLGPERVGIYGSYFVVAHCNAAGTARWYWQCMAWSRGQLFIGAHLYQYTAGTPFGAGEVDFNQAFEGAEAALWMPPGRDAMTPEETAKLDRALAEIAQLKNQIWGDPDGNGAPDRDASHPYADGDMFSLSKALQDLGARFAAIEGTVNLLKPGSAAQVYADIGRLLSQAGGAITAAGNARASNTGGN